MRIESMNQKECLSSLFIIMIKMRTLALANMVGDGKSSLCFIFLMKQEGRVSVKDWIGGEGLRKRRKYERKINTPFVRRIATV